MIESARVCLHAQCSDFIDFACSEVSRSGGELLPALTMTRLVEDLKEAPCKLILVHFDSLQDQAFRSIAMLRNCGFARQVPVVLVSKRKLSSEEVIGALSSGAREVLDGVSSQDSLARGISAVLGAPEAPLTVELSLNAPLGSVANI